MLKDSPEEKQNQDRDVYEALQLYQIGDFRSADDMCAFPKTGSIGNTIRRDATL